MKAMPKFQIGDLRSNTFFETLESQACAFVLASSACSVKRPSPVNGNAVYRAFGVGLQDEGKVPE
jgi:hypothetical protein